MPDPVTDDKKSETIDIEKLNSGIKSMLADSSKSIVSSVLAAVDEKLAGVKPVAEREERVVTQTKTTKLSQALADFQDEIKTLGLDESQTNALMSFVGKITGKKVDEAKSEVKQESKFDEVKKESEALVAGQYPDILTPGSPLHTRAAQIYKQRQQEKDPIANSARFSSVCVRDAAAELGIKPLTLEDIKKSQSKNEGGDPNNFESNDGKASQKSLDFASSFGVDPKKYAEIYKNKIKSGRGEVLRR